MKQQKINPATMNPMEMNNLSSMMSMMSLIQKIGKGKRKYEIHLDKSDKKFLSKFVDEAKKQFPGGNEPQMKPLMEFFSYLKVGCDTKSKSKAPLKISYEELEFMKKMLVDSVKGMEGMTFKWYQVLKKSMLKVLLKQYKVIVKKFD
ncbi:MAG: hypothetical protein ACRCSK_02755 [Fusobacteriaceae bacterium]